MTNWLTFKTTIKITSNNPPTQEHVENTQHSTKKLDSLSVKPPNDSPTQL